LAENSFYVYIKAEIMLLQSVMFRLCLFGCRTSF